MRGTSRYAWLVAGIIFLSLPGSPARADDKDPIDAALDDCLATDKAQSTAGMAGCTSTALKAWDAKLNETYQKAINALDPKSRELLRSAQRQWVAFRAAERATWGGPWQADRGTIIRLQILGADLSAIKERVSELKLYLPAD